MLGIVVALEKESEEFVSVIENKKILNDRKTVITGKINGIDIVLINSGIGKVAAALSTQYIIDAYNPDCILNFGCSGGLKEKVKTLSYYSVENVCQYDFDLSKLDNCPIGYNQNYDSVLIKTKTYKNLPSVSLATSDRFTSEKSDIEIIKNIGCEVFDMEFGAIAQVCLSNSLPFYSIKGITDTVGSGIQSEQFYKNLSIVCQGFKTLIPNVINEIYKK